jgi:hypothetical protein
MRLFLKRRRRDEGMGELILRAYGGVIGRGVLVIFALWLTAYTGLVLRVAGERLVSYVYNDTGWIIFAAVIIGSVMDRGAGAGEQPREDGGSIFPHRDGSAHHCIPVFGGRYQTRQPPPRHLL